MGSNVHPRWLFLVSSIVTVFMHANSLIRPKAPWTDQRYQFYIHNVNKTWDEARTACMATGPGVSLLTVHDTKAWNMWKRLVSPPFEATGKYWFGLEALSISFDEFAWTGCEDSSFTVPLIEDDPAENDTCIFMWVNREVYDGVYKDGWYYGNDCQKEVPFICSVYMPDRACFPRTCDDIIVPSDANTCTTSLCETFLANFTCSHQFVDQDGLCHVWTDKTKEGPIRTVCFLPDIHEAILYCQDVNVSAVAVTPINYTAGEQNTTDHCPRYVEPLDVSGLFNSTHYMYYHRATSWNSAREVCGLHSGTLLTLMATTLEMWHYLLYEAMLIEDDVWIGLHIPDLATPKRLFWDDCSAPPLNGSDAPLNGSCGKITNQGMVPAACNEEHPFICQFDITESSCRSVSCEETLLVVNESECDTFLYGFYDPCFIMYYRPEGICRLTGNVTKNLSTSCIISRNITIGCNETIDVSETYFVAPDNSTDVQDKTCSGNLSRKHTTTTTAPTKKECLCKCKHLKEVTQEPSEEEANLTLEEKIERIIIELTVDKKNTTLNKMKYISATDNRSSSVGIGAVAAIIIFSVFGVIVLIDLSRLFHEAQHVLQGLLSALQLQKISSSGAHVASDAASATSTAFTTPSVLPPVYNDNASITDFVPEDLIELDDSLGANIAPASTSLT